MEETDFEIGDFGNFRTFMTLTLNQVTQYTIMYHSSTSTYIQNFVVIKTVKGWTDIETGFIWSTPAKKTE